MIWVAGGTSAHLTGSLQEEQRLASSRLSKEEAERQLQERTEAAKAISGGVDQVSGPSLPALLVAV